MSNESSKISIRDYMKTHTPQNSVVSNMILGLDDLLVYEVNRDGEGIDQPIVYICTPNMDEIYPDSHGYVICPNCGKAVTNINVYRSRLLDDMPRDNRRVVLQILFKTYKCDCGRIITPPLKCAAEDEKITSRMMKAIGKASFSSRKTFSDVAREYHVSDTQVHKAFNREAGMRSADTLYCTYPHLCIDEVSIHTKKEKEQNPAKTGKSKGTLCITILATGLSDGDESKPNQAVVAFEFPKSRNAKTVEIILDRLEHPEIVETFTMDMCAAYHDAVETVLPHCRIIIDRYHLVQSLNDKVRKVAHNLYCQRRDEAKKQLKQLFDPEMLKLSKEIDEEDDSQSETNIDEIEALFAEKRRVEYKKKLSNITPITGEQREAKEELQFLADNYYNLWFATNSDSLSQTGRIRLKRLFNKYPEFENLYLWKEKLRVEFFEAETVEEALKLANAIAGKIPKGKAYRPLWTYLKNLTEEKNIWYPHIYEYFKDPVGKRYSNAAMEEFNRDVKEMNRNAKGISPANLFQKVLLGDIIYHPREKHLTSDKLNNMLNKFEYLSAFDKLNARDSYIQIDPIEFAAVAVKCGIVSSYRTPEHIIKDRYFSDIPYKKWLAFLDALVMTVNEPKPAVKLYEQCPVFKPFPVANGKLSDPIAFAVLAEDSEALSVYKGQLNAAIFEKSKYRNKLWIPPDIPMFLDNEIVL